MTVNEIGNTPPTAEPQESCDAVIPVAVPVALKLRVVRHYGKGQVSPRIRALIEADLPPEAEAA